MVWALGGQAASHFKLLTSNQSWKPVSADLGFAEASLGQPDDRHILGTSFPDVPDQLEGLWGE